jgi:cytochrome oxidase Cu insertion factor (SCO1/SenC/PrrC family)
MNETKKKRNLWPLWGVLAVTIAPVIASYTMYYGVKPEGRTNYGDFVEPQVTVNDVAVVSLIEPKAESAFAVRRQQTQAGPLDQLGDWQGRWLMVRMGPATCTEACQQELWLMRQIRLTTGRERERVERLWILTDQGTPDPKLLAEHEGLWVVRLQPTKKADPLVSNWLSVAAQSAQSNQGASNIWVIDPLGNLMMRFPDKPDANGMKKDMNRLLKASRIG